jgi:hypothetical protein
MTLYTVLTEERGDIWIQSFSNSSGCKESPLLLVGGEAYPYENGCDTRSLHDY